jgi:hypothetical protein
LRTLDNADRVPAAQYAPDKVERVLLRLVLDRNGQFGVLTECPFPEIGLLKIHVQFLFIPTPVANTT